MGGGKEKMKYKINVNEEDINNGMPGDCHNCAISQALKRYFKTPQTCTEIDGGDVVLKVNDKKYEVNHMHESDVLDFIHDFDNYANDDFNNLDPEELKPITFEIIERST